MAERRSAEEAGSDAPMVWLRNASISASSHCVLADDEMDWLAVVEITVVTWKHFVTSGPWLDHVSFAAPLMTCHLSVVCGQIVALGPSIGDLSLLGR